MVTMKKLLLFVFIFVFLFQACDNSKEADENEFVLKGRLTQSKGEMVYLDELGVDDNYPIDSVKLDDNGEFFFKKKIKEPGFYLLKTADDNFVTLLLDRGETAELNGNIKQLAESYTVFGSKGSEQILAINQHTRNNYAKLDSLALFWDKNKYNENKDFLRDSLDSVAMIIIVDQQHFLMEFIDGNTSSLASLIAIYQVFGRKTMFDEYEHFDLFKEVRDSLYEKYPHNAHQLSFKERVDEVEISLKEKAEREKLLRPGKEAPDIELPGLWKEKVKLSDYAGHPILLYFWSSWNATSRLHNQTVKYLQKLYENKGLVVFAVSLDTNKDLWKNAVELDKLNWVHASDLKYWESPAVKTYNVEKIPHIVLIDREGNIFARNISIDDLAENLRNLFRK